MAPWQTWQIACGTTLAGHHMSHPGAHASPGLQLLGLDKPTRPSMIK
jgi:hypothetical protein